MEPQAAAHGGGEAERKPNLPVSPDAELVPIERLKQYPFLSSCSDIVLRKLQPQCPERPYEPGATILQRAGYSDAAYYIAAGVVGVRVTPVSAARREAQAAEAAAAPKSTAERLQSVPGRTGAAQAVQRPRVSSDGTIMLTDLPVDLRTDEEVLLEAGEVFGEMSALSRYPISADVIARSDVTCLLIRTAGLRLMFKQKELAAFKKMIDDRYRTRTLANHLRTVSLFGGLTDGMIKSLREKAELASFEPGKQIVEQGAAAAAFYLVRGGFVKVAVRAGEADAAVTYLGKGDYAGEIALLLDEPWPFSLY